MNKLLLIVSLFCSTLVMGQPNGANTPSIAWADTSFWYVLDQDIDSLETSWEFKVSDYSDARSISLNKTTDSIQFFNNTAYPSNDQFAYDATWDWFSYIGVQGYGFDEWFIIKVPSSGNVNIKLNQKNGNTLNSQFGASMQWYQFDSTINELSFVSAPSIPSPVEWENEISLSTDILEFDLDEDFSIPSKITKRYILLRIGVNDATSGSLDFINNYYLKISSNNNLCQDAIKAPVSLIPFSDTLNVLDKNLLTNSDELTQLYRDDFDKKDSLYGYNDLVLNSGSPGIWFSVNTEFDTLYLATCGFETDLQFVVFENNCPSVSTLDSIIAAENQNLDLSTLTPGRDVCISNPNNTDIPVVYFPTNASVGTPKSFYVYLFGNNDEGLFDFYFLEPDLFGFGGILPVEWLDFYGLAFDKYNEIYWSTASEFQNDYFILERSSDAENFMEIAKIDGAGDSEFENHYEFKDQQPLSTSYYRISQVDWDGTRDYGSTIVVENETKGANFSIKTNPLINNELIVRYRNDQGEREVSLSLYSLDGKAVLNQLIMLNKGSQEMRIKLVALGDGVYFIHIVDKYQEFNDKIIIQSTN